MWVKHKCGHKDERRTKWLPKIVFLTGSRGTPLEELQFEFPSKASAEIPYPLDINGFTKIILKLIETNFSWLPVFSAS